MVSTEIVNTTNDIHPGVQGLRLASQRAGAASQHSEALVEGGIEPFDESGIDPASTLRMLDQLSDLVGTALHNATADGKVTRGAVFDHLDNRQFRPSALFAATGLTPARYFAAKGALQGLDIARQTIDRHQQGQTQGHRYPDRARPLVFSL